MQRNRILTSVVSLGECSGIIPPPPPTRDPDAEIFFDGLDFATEFYTDETAKDTINELIVRHKDMGTWEDMLFEFPNIGGTEATISRSTKNPDRFVKTYPNGAIFDVSGDKFNGTTQYAKCDCWPSKQLNHYSLCFRWMVKENTFGPDDYVPFGLEPGIVIDHFANNRLFVVIGVRNAPAHVWVLNPAPFGKLMAINYHSFDTVDYWQDGTLAGTQVDSERYYLPPIDPTDVAAQMYLGADNQGAGFGYAPVSFAPFTYFYQSFGHHMTDADLISDNTYIRDVFCPAMFKIPD